MQSLAANSASTLPLTFTTSANSLNAPSTLVMTLSGSQAWDMRLDSVRVSIPEPASLALMGLALTGIGFARRRSK